MRKPKWIVQVALIFIASFFLASHAKCALAASAADGITVSPAFQQVSIPTGEAMVTVSFSITNDKSVPQTIKLSSADFNTLNESGGLFFVGTNPTALEKKYGLAKWFRLPQDEYTIRPKQTQVIKADILNLSDLAGGGHYGALMIRVADSAVDLANPNKVSIDPIASSLLFVTKMGGDSHKLSLVNVSYRHSLVNMPVAVKLMFKNTGNTHVVPRGVIKVLGSNNELVSQGTINQNSNIILPESSRIYNVALRNISAANRPGKYKLVVDYRFDGIDQPREYQSSFWHLTFSYAAIPVLIIVALGCGAIYIMKRRKKIRRD